MTMMKAYARIAPDDMWVQRVEVPVPDPADDEALVWIEAFGGMDDRYFIPQDARFPYVIEPKACGASFA